MNLKNNDLKELITLLSVILLVILIFSFVLFGVTGVRVVLGLIFISVPFYFILNNFELNYGEKSVFSILLGLTIFPSLVYLFGLVVSFRLGILITFIAFICIAIASKYKSKKLI